MRSFAWGSPGAAFLANQQYTIKAAWQAQNRAAKAFPSGWQVRHTHSICISQSHSCAGRRGTDPISGTAVFGRLLLVAN
ncbi:TPA: hypothetical protein ACH3X2_010941 [Trebouxia sp. C0005]